MQSVAGVPKDLIGIMQSVIVFFISADYLLRKKLERPFSMDMEQESPGKGVQSNGTELSH